MDQSSLELGRARYQERAWADAYQLLSQADAAAPLGVEDLERLALSAALTARSEELLKIEERLYQAHLDAGAELAAARTAFWLGYRLLAFGEPARGSGWLARAERLVERAGRPCVEQGYLLLPAAQRQLAARELESATATAARAAAVGDEFGDANLAALARNIQGRALVRQARVDEGLRLLDEVMVSATTGELSPLVTGLVYCAVIDSCQQVYALDRAREWTEVLAGWVEGQPQLVMFSGACLVHRAEILQLRGAWGEAVEEARRACERCPPAIDPYSAAGALPAGARSTGCAASSPPPRRPTGWPASGAWSRNRGWRCCASGATGRRRPAPSAGCWARQWKACGDCGCCRPAWKSCWRPARSTRPRRPARNWRSIAAQMKTEVVGAMAAHARGALRLAGGDAAGALEPLRQAFEVWQKAGAPYLAARLRLMLARACLALRDCDGARLDLAAAREVFDRLGAAPDLAAVDALVAELETAGKPGKSRTPAAAHRLTERELQVLRLVASGKTNKAIASELALSEKTVDRHVSNIFNKVDVPTRAAATAYAYEHGLV